MWEQIRSNRIRSVILVAGMGVLLLVLGYFLGYLFAGDPVPGIVIAVIVWLIMNLVAFFEGDSIMLAVSGARKITRDDHPRLYNIVEEMKIASGLEKMPDIYIIDDPSPNAFATGRSPERASIAVTSGLLEKMNRDELQGVVGHEVSHVKNRDVMLMSMAGVMLGTVVILAWYASRMLFFSGMAGNRRSSRDGGGGGQIIILAVGIIFMILAPIAAQLLYYAVSRKREYLADASSALYTRYPEGLASALEKIAAATQPVKTANRATAPMYIVNPLRGDGMAASDISSTHPPISRRVKILRAMAGASFADYEKAYEKISGGRVMPASALAASGSLGLREASASKELGEETADHLKRARETSNLMWRMGNYRTVACPCGTNLKVPPSFREPAVQCPHCGRFNQL